MANQRNADQVLVGFWTDKAFAAKIDKERGRRARSDFLREVLREYLQAKGFKVSDTESSAPDRLGKGGPARYEISPQAKLEMNETASSAGPPTTAEGAKKISGDPALRVAKSETTPATDGTIADKQARVAGARKRRGSQQ